MPQGLQVWDASGNLVFDSNDATGGVAIDAVQASTGAVVVSYPQFAGRTIVPTAISGDVSQTLTVDYSLGYPRVTIPAYGSSTGREPRYLMNIQ